MRRIGSLILTIVLVLGLCACGRDVGATWQEQYDLGARYLSEGNYEEAILAFTAAIEIDPKRSEAYLKVAEAYQAMGNMDEAQEILRKGYEITGEELLKPTDPKPNGWGLEDPVTADELTIGGVPFYRADLATAQAAYPHQNDEVEPFKTQEDGLVEYHPCKVVSEDGGHSKTLIYSSFSAAQRAGSDTIGEVTYRKISDTRQYQPEFRGIIMGETFEVIAKRLGFTQSGIEYIFDTIEKDGEGSFATISQSSEKYDVNIPYVNWNLIFEDSEPFFVRLFWQHPDDELSTILLTLQVDAERCVDTIWIDII